MWKDYFIYSWNFLPLAAAAQANLAAANSVFTDNPLRMDVFCDFSAMKIAYTNTDPRVYLQIKDGSTGRYIVQDPGVDMRAYAGAVVAIGGGSNALIFRNLSKPMTWLKGSSINVRLADFSAAPNTVRVSFHGVKMRDGNHPSLDLKRNYIRDEAFAFPVQVSLTANQIIQNPIAIDLDADWYIYRILATRTGGATIALTNTISAADWQNVAVNLDNFTGNAAGHLILPEPKFVQANSALNIQLADLSGNPNTINLTIEGIKRYFS